MGQDDKGEEDENMRGKVNGEGSHDIPESGGLNPRGVTGGAAGSEDSPMDTE